MVLFLPPSPQTLNKGTVRHLAASCFSDQSKKAFLIQLYSPRLALQPPLIYASSLHFSVACIFLLLACVAAACKHKVPPSPPLPLAVSDVACCTDTLSHCKHLEYFLSIQVWDEANLLDQLVPHVLHTSW